MISFIIIFPLSLLAIFIPPNNWDSMAYHLPRVEHWIQNKNIYPYPTNIVRQVLTSPLSEYIIANFQILANTDAFSNLVQFASFIFILIIGTLIFSILKIGLKGQLFLLLALLSLPMMLFQATTTQTDLLASFFFISFILFSLLIIQTEANFKTNFIFLVLSLTLGILTKYHIAIFAAPIVLYLLFILFKKKTNANTIFAVLISCLTIALILAPLFLRNIYFFGSITGKDLFDENAKLLSIEISPVNSTIPVGTTINYSATGTYSDGKTRNIGDSLDWLSTDESISKSTNRAGVSFEVIGISVGTTTIEESL